MSAGLAASTVTPGSTAPPSSRTTPAIVPLEGSCAHEIAGVERTSTARTAANRGMTSSLGVVTLARSLVVLADPMQRSHVDSYGRSAYIPAHAEAASASNSRVTGSLPPADVHRVGGLRTGHMEERRTVS